MKAFTRRGLVQVAGAGAAGVLVSKAQALTFLNGRVGSLKAGVLLASGGSYDRMGDSSLDGFRMAMDEQGVSATVVTRPVAKGCEGVYEQTSELLAAGVDVVVGNVTVPVARLLTPLFAQKKKPLVVANAGGHVPLPGDRSAYVVHTPDWQSGFALGKWAAGKLGRKGFIAASLADSGYDAVYAFRRGFESARGTIADTDVTHVDPGSPRLTELFSAIRAASPSFVYALYTGPVGADFVKSYASSGLSTPLIGGASSSTTTSSIPSAARRKESGASRRGRARICAGQPGLLQRLLEPDGPQGGSVRRSRLRHGQPRGCRLSERQPARSGLRAAWRLRLPAFPSTVPAGSSPSRARRTPSAARSRSGSFRASSASTRTPSWASHRRSAFPALFSAEDRNDERLLQRGALRLAGLVGPKTAWYCVPCSIPPGRPER